MILHIVFSLELLNIFTSFQNHSLKDLLSYLLLPSPNGRATIHTFCNSEYLNAEIPEEPVTTETKT